MNIKIGDKVKFLNEKGEGTVSKIINKTSVGVTIEDGFELPFLITELVLIADNTIPQPVVKPYVQQVVQSSSKQEKKTKTTKQEGIYIAFSPEKIDDIEHSDINVWFINHTAYQTFFSCSVLLHPHYSTLEATTAEAFESVLIDTIAKKEVERFGNFKIDVVFYDEREHTPLAPLSEVVKFRIVKLYKENAFQDNSFIAEKAFVIALFRIDDVVKKENTSSPTADLSKLLFQKKTTTDTPRLSKPHAINNLAYEMEIDIHIEELLDDYSRMSNLEIMKVQLNFFQNALDKAISENYRKLIVIHGVGNGRLKSEVRNILQSYDSLQVYDASLAKYGFGATEIVIGN